MGRPYRNGAAGSLSCKLIRLSPKNPSVDPASVDPALAGSVEPVPAASVLLATPGEDGLTVLMVRRPPRGLFGGIWVFPGGTVDPGDHADGDGLTDCAFRRAAVRELAEEVGIDVEVASLAFVSRWVTPANFPRRYDTCFYLASLSASPPWTLAPQEVEAAAYISPVAALAAHEAQEWPMVLPTLAHLRWLGKFATIQEAVEATKDAKPNPVTPVVMEDGSLLSVDLPW